jgi:glyoxylase-like metal-dependent hydrolase (beta-lactamase superfamily II)
MGAEIAPLALKQLLAEEGAKRPVIVDVREPEEFQDWRIDGSVNIPVGELWGSPRLKDLPKAAEIVAICAHGIRSASAVSLLRQAGFRARHLAGGLAAWSRTYDPAPVDLDFDGLQLIQVRRLGKGCTSYLVGYHSEAAIIDPSVHTSEYLDLAKAHGLQIRHVMDTHLHADHVSGARALAQATGATLHLNPQDPHRGRDFEPLTDGAEIRVGGNATLRALHTPGHTKGSTSFLLRNEALLTGDTLFVEGIARPDLHQHAEEFAGDLYRTYHAQLGALSEEVQVLPGHFSQVVPVEFGKAFYASLGTLRKRMPLLEAPESTFRDYVLANLPPKPPNYEIILAINRSGEVMDPAAVAGLEEGPNRCALPT